MGEIKAGVVVVTKFCKPKTKAFKAYIDYIDRDEATRKDNSYKYNLYQDYMGNPEKTSSIFNRTKDELSVSDKKEMKKLFEAAQEKESLMWQTVISFDNRWLEENGIYDSSIQTLDEQRLKAITRKAVDSMLEKENLQNAVWSAAIHFNTDNIHVHVATIEPEPIREKKEYTRYEEITDDSGRKKKVPVKDKDGNIIKDLETKGSFKPSSIEECKRQVVNEIINDKENNIVINKIIRESIVKQKKEHPLSKDKELADQFLRLYKRMPDVNRNLWNYNNNILHSLRPEIDKLADTYIEMYHKEDIEEFNKVTEKREANYKIAYGKTDRSYKEGKIKDLHTRLGNAILREIREYDKQLKNDEKELGVNIDPLEKFEDFEPDIEAKFDRNANKQLEDFIEPEADVESTYYEWSKEYKYAKKLIHKKNPDYDKAINILVNEHRKGNILATYEFGDIYKYGRGKQIDIDTANKYYQLALRGFENQLKLSGGDIKKQYRIGKMYYYGLGDDINYEKAAMMFEKSGNQFSKYMLGKMAYNGQGMEKDYDKAFAYFEEVSDVNAYASYKAASMLENGEKKLGVNIDPQSKIDELYGQAFAGFMSMEAKQEDDNLEYRIGMMYLNGKGVDENRDTAIEYLEKAAEAKNVFAMNKLSQLYLETGEQEKIKAAMNYLNIAATKGKNAMAMYSLGNVYYSDRYGMQDIEKAKQWFEKSVQNGNEIASYKLGKIYMNEDDYAKAINCFEKSDNKYAKYNLAKIYLNVNESYYNPEMGIAYLEEASWDGNEFAQYRLGKEYYSGENTKQNIDKAIYWFAEVAEKNHYAAYSLGKIYLDESLPQYDAEKGIAYLEKAAEMGNDFALIKLGFEYLKGNHVERNNDLAKDYFTRAAEMNNELAKDILKDFKKISKRYQQEDYRRKIRRGIGVSSAIKKLKKAMDNEFEKQMNEREHDELTRIEMDENER